MMHTVIMRFFWAGWNGTVAAVAPDPPSIDKTFLINRTIDTAIEV